MATIKSVQLFFQEGTSDKVYNAAIVEDGGAYTVQIAWGRRGSKLAEGSKAVRVTRAKAEATFDRLVREKRGKGYEEIAPGVAPAAVAPPVGQTLVVTNRNGQPTQMASAGALAGLGYAPHGTIVDGEVVGDTLWMFDVLSFAGVDVRKQGYLKRWEILDEELEPALTGNVRILPLVKGAKAKRKLHDKLRSAGAEGIVFKQRDAPYAHGRVMTQRKHKFIKTADVIILENAGNAYKMAVMDGSKIFECGRVFAGTTNASRKDLDARLGRGERPVAEVRYLYATDDHQLFQPVFVGVRDDKLARSCLRDQLLQTSRRVII